MKKSLFICSLALMAGMMASAAPKPTLVLEKITYRDNQMKNLLVGGDQLLLQKLVHADKYTVMDRDAYEAMARERALNNQEAELEGTDRVMFTEFIDCTKTGKNIMLPGNKRAEEYILRLTLKICRYEGKRLLVDTIENERLEAAAVSKIDLVDDVVSKLARKAIFAVSFATPQISDIDAEEGLVEIDYNRDFFTVGEVYEVKSAQGKRGGLKSRKAVRTQIEITEVGEECCIGKVLCGTPKVGDRLTISTEAPARPLTPPAPSTFNVVVSSFGFDRNFKGSLTHQVQEKIDVKIPGKVERKLGPFTDFLGPFLTTPKTVNEVFRSNMERNQTEMLKSALQGHPRFTVQDLDGQNIKGLLERGVTHVMEGSILAADVDEIQKTVSIQFALKLVDINNNNSIVANRADLVVQMQGAYSEPGCYVYALTEAVKIFTAGIP